MRSMKIESESIIQSVESDSLRPHGLYPARLLLSFGFSRQEYWSGWPFPSPGDLPDQGIEPRSPSLNADSLSFEPSGKTNEEYKVIVDEKLPKKKKEVNEKTILPQNSCS